MSSDIKVRFGKRLADAIKKSGITYTDLAHDLGYKSSSSLISQWVTGEKLPRAEKLPEIAMKLNVSLDWLWGIKDGLKQHGGIRWVEHVPGYLPNIQKKQVEVGLELFNELVVKGNSFQKLIADGYSITETYAAFQLALDVGAFTVVDVRRDEALEEKLQKLFGIRQVIVADVPPHDGTILRAEYIAHLLAQYTLPTLYNLNAPRGIGLGHGYTLFRFASISASMGQLGNIHWIPLSASRTNDKINSANFNALLMAHRHSGTQALYTPYASQPSDLSTRETAQRDAVIRATQSANAVFTSCNGSGRSSLAVPPQIGDQFRSSNFLDLGEMRLIYEQFIRGTKYESEFAGELLGIMLNKHAQPIGDKQLHNRMRESFFQVDLDLLKEICLRGGSVWVAGARLYKALPIYTLLTNKIANAMVVDSEIARELILLSGKEENEGS